MVGMGVGTWVLKTWNEGWIDGGMIESKRNEDYKSGGGREGRMEGGMEEGKTNKDNAGVRNRFRSRATC